MNSRWLWGGAVLVVVLIGAYYLLQGQKPKYAPTPYTPAKTPTVTYPSVSPSKPQVSPAEQVRKNTITITAAGFSPKEVTIKIGDSISWVNNDSTDHSVNSAVHPTHQLYPSLNLGLIKPGASKSLIFPKAGIYKYHDHLNPSLTGTVIVQ